MRPCNQCRKPVENKILICDDCAAWNAENEPELGEPEHDPRLASPDGDFYADHSYSILMGIFSLIITMLFALVGLAVNDFNGFVVGGGAGLVVGALTFTALVKM